MRKLSVLSLVILVLAALPACAQLTTQRFSFLGSYMSPAEAGSVVAGGNLQPMIYTGGPSVPYLSLALFYCTSGTVCNGTTCHTIACSIYAPPPPPIQVSWHEFATWTDPMCQPAANRPSFRSLQDCATWWAEKNSRPVSQGGYTHAGTFTTTERTTVIWGFNDPLD